MEITYSALKWMKFRCHGFHSGYAYEESRADRIHSFLAATDKYNLHLTRIKVENTYFEIDGDIKCLDFCYTIANVTNYLGWPPGGPLLPRVAQGTSSQNAKISPTLPRHSYLWFVSPPFILNFVNISNRPSHELCRRSMESTP
jgi:hypothetical protein